MWVQEVRQNIRWKETLKWSPVFSFSESELVSSPTAPGNSLTCAVLNKNERLRSVQWSTVLCDFHVFSLKKSCVICRAVSRPASTKKQRYFVNQLIIIVFKFSKEITNLFLVLVCQLWEFAAFLCFISSINEYVFSCLFKKCIEQKGLECFVPLRWGFGVCLFFVFLYQCNFSVFDFWTSCRTKQEILRHCDRHFWHLSDKMLSW